MTPAPPVRDNDVYVPAATDADVHDSTTPAAAPWGHGAVSPSALMDDEYWAKFPEPLTLRAIATILRVSETTVLRRLQDSTIPGHFIGGSWIVFKGEFRAWLATTRNEPFDAGVNTDPLAEYEDELGMSELIELFDKTKQTIRKWLLNKTIPGYQVLGRWTVYKAELHDTLVQTSNQAPVDE
jgi:hypothetical protein